MFLHVTLLNTVELIALIEASKSISLITTVVIYPINKCEIIVYCICVKFHQYQFIKSRSICVYKIFGQTDGQGDSDPHPHPSQKLCLQKGWSTSVFHYVFYLQTFLELNCEPECVSLIKTY